MFNNVYKNKKVLITGNTGFKGSWLTCWLLSLGADVTGISKDIPSNPSMFEDLDLESKINYYNSDIRDLNELSRIINQEKPEFLFHLAAQPIVSTSYSDPVETISSNAIGTMNILETLRHANFNCAAVLITSDKSYDNVEWVWGYKESDKMGGKDIYSGSKGAAELIIKSYFHSFFENNESLPRIGVGRAGNVIGGGDWAKDRIIVDAVRSWSNSKSVKIRCPDATRPWQHVLEPLSGYLSLGQNLYSTKDNVGEAYNFGPRAEQNRTVKDLLDTMLIHWKKDLPKRPYVISDTLPFKEASLLKLNCDKALSHLKWDATLEYDQTVKMTSEWYSSYFNDDIDMYKKTIDQISEYVALASKRDSSWTL